jgi:hypothetical protein
LGADRGSRRMTSSMERRSRSGQEAHRSGTSGNDRTQQRHGHDLRESDPRETDS